MNMGHHIIVNLLKCPAKVLEKVNIVQKLLNEIVSEASLTKVGESFYQFEPKGVTGIILLAESHISIHTWPEHESAAVDIFCCGGKESAKKAYELLVKKFEPSNVKKHEVSR